MTCNAILPPLYFSVIANQHQLPARLHAIHGQGWEKQDRGGKKRRNQCFNNIKGRLLSAGLPWERRRGPEPARTYPQRPGAGPARDQNNKDSLWQSWGAAVREEWNQMWHFSFICKCLLGGTLTRNDSWALTKLKGADGRIEESWQRL